MLVLVLVSVLGLKLGLGLELGFGVGDSCPINKSQNIMAHAILYALFHCDASAVCFHLYMRGTRRGSILGDRSNIRCAAPIGGFP